MKPLKRSDMEHTELHQCMPIPRKCSTDGVSPDWGREHIIAAYSSFIYPRKDERLKRPGWLTYSGRFTHITGHPSAAGRAQSRQSSPSKTNDLPLYHTTNIYCVCTVYSHINSSILVQAPSIHTTFNVIAPWASPGKQKCGKNSDFWTYALT